MGCPFERVGKRLISTAEGEDFLTQSAHLLDHAQNLVNRTYGLEQSHSGVLRIGASPQTIAWLVSPAMAEFKSKFPDVSLIVSEGHNDKLIELVDHGSVHLSIACLGINSMLTGEQLFTAQLFAIFPKHHKLSNRASISIEELSEDQLLVMRRGFLTRHIFDQTCSAHTFRPQILLECDSTHTLSSLAKDGHGVAIVSSSAQDTPELSKAIPIQSKLCRTRADVSAIWNPKRYRPASMQSFVELLTKYSAT